MSQILEKEPHCKEEANIHKLFQNILKNFSGSDDYLNLPFVHGNLFKISQSLCSKNPSACDCIFLV